MIKHKNPGISEIGPLQVSENKLSDLQQMERRLWGANEAFPNLFESGNHLCSQCEGFQDVAGFKKDVSAFLRKTKESIGPV